MSETFTDWDLFAAAWLAKTIVVPPPHGETAESYAAKQCDTSGASRRPDGRHQDVPRLGPSARAKRPVATSIGHPAAPHRA